MFDEMWQEIQESSGEIFDIQEDSWNDDQDSNKLSSEEEFNRYLNSNFECAWVCHFSNCPLGTPKTLQGCHNTRVNQTQTNGNFCTLLKTQQ